MASRQLGNPDGRSHGSRILRGVLGFFVVPFLMARDGLRTAYPWLRRAPIVVKILIVLVMLGGAAGGIFVLKKRSAGRGLQAVAGDWRRFESAAKTVEVDELKSILDDLLVKDPTNTDALARKKALETGEADPTDRSMVALMLRIHLKHNRTRDALREAKKMVDLDPKDWMANCIMGQDAIERKDEAGIEKYLSAVEDPDSAIRPDLGGVLFAIELHRQAGRDATILRAYTLNRVIPFLRNANLSTFPPAGRVQILACYIDTCLSVPDVSVKNLVQFWAWASTLADGTLDDAKEKKNSQVLSQLGSLQPPLAGVALRFQKLDLMSERDAQIQAKEVEDRARKIWAEIRLIDPKNPAGYVGEAHALLRAGDTAGAREMIEAGLKSVGSWDPSLLSAYTLWAKRAKQSEAVLPLLIEIAKRNPAAVGIWQLVAELAEDSNRRDIAIDAIRKVRAAAQDNAMLLWAEARLWADADQPEKAMELFEKIPEKERLRTAAVARVYVRVLAGVGKSDQIPAVNREVMTAADKANDSALALAPALALLDGTPTADQALRAGEFAEQVLIRWPSSLDALRALATARVRSAELSKPAWQEIHVRKALDALDRLKNRDSSDVWAAAMTGWLRLKGKIGVGLAWNDLSRVAAAESDPNLPADVLEALGTGYLEKGRFTDALRVFKRAANTSRQPAGPMLALALAYHKSGDVRAGRDVFRQVQTMSQSDRVREEYIAAAPLFQE